MSVKYTVGRHLNETTFVTYEGEALTPEDALAAVAVVTKEEPKVGGSTPVDTDVRPKVGDRVVAVQDDNDDMFHVGDTGTIVEDDGSSCPFYVRWDHSGKEWWAYESEVELS